MFDKNSPNYGVLLILMIAYVFVINLIGTEGKLVIIGQTCSALGIVIFFIYSIYKYINDFLLKKDKKSFIYLIIFGIISIVMIIIGMSILIDVAKDIKSGPKEVKLSSCITYETRLENNLKLLC